MATAYRFAEQRTVNGGGDQEVVPVDGPDIDEIEAAEAEAQRRRRVRDAVEACVSRLSLLVAEQISRRNHVEDRWLADLRAYHGRYDANTEAQLKESGKSRVFVKLSRAKTHGWEARISDMLFPTDDKNWGIAPTPVPMLTHGAQEAVRRRDEALARANSQLQQAETADDAAQQAQLQSAAAQSANEADEFAQAASQHQAELDEARRRSVLMEKTIEDQLTESRYATQCREAVHDSCKLGTGIIKGPMVANRVRKQWHRQTTSGGKVVYVVSDVADPRPEYRRVDLWSFFPDMSGRRIDDTEFTFERHLMTEGQLKALAKQPGFDREAIGELLASRQMEAVPDYIAKMREITGVQQDMSPRYLVWEYHGPLEQHEWVSILQAAGDVEQLQAVADNPLDEYRVVLFFCGTRILKFGEHPMETGDGLYSVFNFERDDACIFGFGVPHLMADSQNAVNAAWRMMLDNGGLSAGPQIIIDKTQVTPQDGRWELMPRKIWIRNGPSLVGQSAAFQIEEIRNNQSELANVIMLARDFADEETSMPKVAQGEIGAHNQGTASGTSMLLNSANVVFRRVIKNFDDDMTIPNIRRAYHWNMAFNDNEAIKGDMEVDARGSSVLLVRELQAQNLMSIINAWSNHPVLGRLLKVADAARKTVQALMISPDDIIKDDDTLKREDELAAQQPPPKSPDDYRLEIAQIVAQARLEVAAITRETAMARLAEERNMTLDQIRGALARIDAETKSKERMLAAEIGIDVANRDKDRASAPAVEPNDGGGTIGGGGRVAA